MNNSEQQHRKFLERFINERVKEEITLSEAPDAEQRGTNTIDQSNNEGTNESCINGRDTNM